MSRRWAILRCWTSALFIPSFLLAFIASLGGVNSTKSTPAQMPMPHSTMPTTTTAMPEDAAKATTRRHAVEWTLTQIFLERNGSALAKGKWFWHKMKAEGRTGVDEDGISMEEMRTTMEEERAGKQKAVKKEEQSKTVNNTTTTSPPKSNPNGGDTKKNCPLVTTSSPRPSSSSATTLLKDAISTTSTAIHTTATTTMMMSTRANAMNNSSTARSPKQVHPPRQKLMIKKPYNQTAAIAALSSMGLSPRAISFFSSFRLRFLLTPRVKPTSNKNRKLLPIGLSSRQPSTTPKSGATTILLPPTTTAKMTSTSGNGSGSKMMMMPRPSSSPPPTTYKNSNNFNKQPPQPQQQQQKKQDPQQQHVMHDVSRVPAALVYPAAQPPGNSPKAPGTFPALEPPKPLPIAPAVVTTTTPPTTGQSCEPMLLRNEVDGETRIFVGSSRKLADAKVAVGPQLQAILAGNRNCTKNAPHPPPPSLALSIPPPPPTGPNNYKNSRWPLPVARLNPLPPVNSGKNNNNYNSGGNSGGGTGCCRPTAQNANSQPQCCRPRCFDCSILEAAAPLPLMEVADHDPQQQLQPLSLQSAVVDHEFLLNSSSGTSPSMASAYQPIGNSSSSNVPTTNIGENKLKEAMNASANSANNKEGGAIPLPLVSSGTILLGRPISAEKQHRAMGFS